MWNLVEFKHYLSNWAFHFVFKILLEVCRNDEASIREDETVSLSKNVSNRSFGADSKPGLFFTPILISKISQFCEQFWLENYPAFFKLNSRPNFFFAKVHSDTNQGHKLFPTNKSGGKKSRNILPTSFSLLTLFNSENCLSD